MSKKKKKSKKDLAERFEALSEVQQAEILSRAARLRKAELMRRQNRKRNWQQDMHKTSLASDRGRVRGNLAELDEWVRKAMAMADDIGSLDDLEDKKFFEGVVTILSRGGGFLMTEAAEEKAFTIRPEIKMMQKSGLSPGERVLYSESDGDIVMVERLLQRSSILSRPDPTRRGVERVIAVNMDVIGIVAALDSPPLNLNLIDRFLIAVKQSGAAPMLIVNKMDLRSDEHEEVLSQLEHYQENLGLKIFYVSAHLEKGLDDLIDFLQGKSSIFVGASGVGKSSMLNAIAPGLNLKTQETREKFGGKGRHTTVMSSLFYLSNGLRIMDTPGIRELSLYDISEEELPYSFGEFAELEPCRFNNCRHLNEIHCQVKEAVVEGKIPEHRYESYLKLLETLQAK